MADAQLSEHDLVRTQLLDSDDEFRQLVSEHHALDEAIGRLSHASYLTDQEKLEETALKKRKLALKDRIETALRQHHGTGPVSAPHH
jgi:uncharacterized protein YdcH (DUF465 family)